MDVSYMYESDELGISFKRGIFWPEYTMLLWLETIFPDS